MGEAVTPCGGQEAGDAGGNAIVELSQQFPVELMGILVKQSRYEYRRGGVESHGLAGKLEPEGCAQPVGGIEPQRFAPGARSFRSLAGLPQHLAKPVPPRCPGGRQRQRLAHQFCGGAMIARLSQHGGVIGTAIGNRIARGKGNFLHV